MLFNFAAVSNADSEAGRLQSIRLPNARLLRMEDGRSRATQDAKHVLETIAMEVKGTTLRAKAFVICFLSEIPLERKFVMINSKSQTGTNASEITKITGGHLKFGQHFKVTFLPYYRAKRKTVVISF